MANIWDLMPASMWPTQPFIPPLNLAPASWSPTTSTARQFAGAPLRDPPHGEAALFAPLGHSAIASPNDVAMRSGTLRDSPLANVDPYRQMYEDAKQAHDFVMWLLQPPAKSPPSQQPIPAPPPPTGKMDPSRYIESMPLDPPVLPNPPQGYNEGDKMPSRFQDNPNVDLGIEVPMSESEKSVDPRIVRDPTSIFAPYSGFRWRRLR
jgi:hypothetical protein